MANAVEPASARWELALISVCPGPRRTPRLVLDAGRHVAAELDLVGERQRGHAGIVDPGPDGMSLAIAPPAQDPERGAGQHNHKGFPDAAPGSFAAGHLTRDPPRLLVSSAPGPARLGTTGSYAVRGGNP
ncbi:MAG: hypothetical protein ACREJ5_02910 [Geminicoccaceae bacterium]